VEIVLESLKCEVIDLLLAKCLSL